MKVLIIGQGYVGLTISAFAAKHHEVLGFDLNAKVVSELNKGISHIEGVDSKDIKDAIYAGNYKATTDPADIAGSEIVVISVPTHLDANRKTDLTYIHSACKVIAENLT
ncbi:MAG: nucleotide sugar dehydrogenase, partial [Polynucleobacter sp.]|nr:nucleotide sugar dehydrogenase [Polynucleobacter sp.]